MNEPNPIEDFSFSLRELRAMRTDFLAEDYDTILVLLEMRARQQLGLAAEQDAIRQREELKDSL